MPTSLHQRQKSSADPFPISPPSSNSYGFHFSQRTASFFSRPVLLALVSLLVLLVLLLPSTGRLSSLVSPSKLSSTSSQRSKWRDCTLADVADFIRKKGTVIVCAVSQPYLPFLSNWLISISRQKHQDEVLVIAEDYATLYEVNEKWPGHAVLVPPAPDAQTAHKFGS